MAPRVNVSEWVSMSCTIHVDLVLKRTGWVIASAAIYDTCRGQDIRLPSLPTVRPFGTREAARKAALRWGFKTSQRLRLW